MRRLVLILLAITILGARPAAAISVRDIIELSKTGLGDEILLAIIDTERKVFPIDPATLKLLKDSGVSERVILAMVRSGRMQPVEPPAPPVQPVPEPAPVQPPEPRVIVIDHHDNPPPVREVAVPVPVYVPVFVPRHGRSTPIVPFSTIGLPQSRLGLSSPPPKPTSDPPYWKQMQK